MRRTLMICMITALAAFPMMAGAQSAPPIPEGRSTEGYLIPEGAHPREPTLEAVPGAAVPERNLVRDAQIALRDAGFEPGRIDGVMGPKTQAALREFQASYGLPQTGRLDSTTQERLLAEAPTSSWQR
jgi:hypothetical protein